MRRTSKNPLVAGSAQAGRITRLDEGGAGKGGAVRPGLICRLILPCLALCLAALSSQAAASAGGRPVYIGRFATRASTEHMRTPGAQLWAQRYDGQTILSRQGTDDTSAIGVSPDGTKVFV